MAIKNIFRPIQVTHYFRKLKREDDDQKMVSAPSADPASLKNESEQKTVPAKKPSDLKETNLVIQENQTGVSYYRLFADYFKGAGRIEMQDPFIRKVYQIHNLLEFLQVLIAVKEDGEELNFHLVTSSGDIKRSEIEYNLNEIKESLINVDITFTWSFDESIHDRYVTTDTGWKIILGRGLDIFQRFDRGALSLEQISQEARFCKPFEVTYILI